MEQKMLPREGLRTTPANRYNFREIRENVSIEDMANILNLGLDTRGRFRAPCHDDNNPSAVIGRSHGCDNWHCFTCGISGSVIDLVAYAIGAAEFVTDGPRKGKLTYDSVLAACDFIAKYHPEIVHSAEDEAILQPTTRPKVTRDFIKELGLESNPYFKTRVSFDDPVAAFEERKKPKRERQIPVIDDEIVLTETEATMLILDKIEERMDKYMIFEEQIMQSFPNLDKNAKEEIKKETKARVSALLERQKEFLDYLKIIAPEIFLDTDQFEEVEKE